MNPFLNPITGLSLLKNYIFDPPRLNKRSPSQVKKYKDKIFRKMINYAYTVPMYHKKYKESNIYPSDIKRIEDIKKLPFVTKKDFINNFPEGLIPKGYNKNKAGVVSTSGSTGNPVSFYIDFETLTKSLSLFFREGINYNFNWRKTKVASIGNFSEGKADQVFDKTVMSNTGFLYNTDNKLSMNAYDDMK